MSQLWSELSTNGFCTHATPPKFLIEFHVPVSLKVFTFKSIKKPLASPKCWIHVPLFRSSLGLHLHLHHFCLSHSKKNYGRLLFQSVFWAAFEGRGEIRLRLARAIFCVSCPKWGVGLLCSLSWDPNFHCVSSFTPTFSAAPVYTTYKMVFILLKNDSANKIRLSAAPWQQEIVTKWCALFSVLL